MSATRLTQAARSEIANQLVAKAFDEKLKEARDGLQSKIEAFVIRWHGDHWAQMQKLPKDAFKRFGSTLLHLRGGGHLYLTRDEGLPPLGVFDSFPRSVIESDFAKVMGKREGDALLAASKAINALHIERDKFRKDVTGVLASVPTYKRLHEVWPELRDINPPVADEGKAPECKALAPSIHKLNVALGLTAKK